jgi:hypothetical protein
MRNLIINLLDFEKPQTPECDASKPLGQVTDALYVQNIAFNIVSFLQPC